MTTTNSTDRAAAEAIAAGARDAAGRDAGHAGGPAADAGDQAVHTFQYGHGRMPVFMKLAWLAFLVFGAWYVATYLLGALGGELGAG